MTWLIMIATILLIVATTEVQLWCFTLNRHAWWLQHHPHEDRRSVNYKSLYYSSTFAALLSALTLFTWIFIMVMGCSCSISIPATIMLWFIAMGGKLVLISHLSLLSKLCRLNKYYYPILTTMLCHQYKKLIK